MNNLGNATLLNRQHNALLPVGKLIDEVLLDVFKAYRTLCFDVENYNIARYAWLRVTRVCHHWRGLALYTPSLWSTIYTDADICIVLAMLERSKQSLLTITPTLGDGEDRTSILSLLMPELHRIRHLDASNNTFTLQEILDACDSSLPSQGLAHLALNLCQTTTPIDPAVVLARFGAERLRSLLLESTTALLPSPFSLPSSLQELSLGHYAEAPWPANRLSALVSELPCLRSLTLENLIPEGFSPRAKITLLNLVSLSLTDALPRITSFISWIRTPALRDMTLYGSDAAEGSVVLELSQVIRARLLDGGATPVFTSFLYNQSGFEECDYVTATLTGDNDSALPARRLHVDFSLIFGQDDVLPTFISALPLRSVTYCELGLCEAGGDTALLKHDDDYAGWRTAFGGLVSLEDLIIDDDYWKHWNSDEDFLGRDGLRAFFPALKGLRIGQDLHWPLWPESRPFWDSYLEIIETRTRLEASWGQSHPVGDRRWQLDGIKALFKALPFDGQ